MLILKSVEKKNETAGKTNKAYELWVVSETTIISSLILILSQVIAGKQTEA